MNKSRLNAAVESAANNPLDALVSVYGDQLGSGLYTLGKAGFNLFGAEDPEGQLPAGMFQRTDAINTVPGQRNTTVDGQNINDIWNNMQAMLGAFNASNDALVAFLTFPVVSPNEKIGIPVNPGFQRATEFGRPTKVRTREISRGYPLAHYDLGDGYTQEFIDRATGPQLMAVQATILEAWTRLQRELVLAALMGPANYTDDDGINVVRLYNADSEVVPDIKRWDNSSHSTHYLATGGDGQLDVADLNSMSEHLIHHGFREFGDASFLLIAHRDEIPAVRGFTGFIPAETGERPQELANSGVVVGPQRGAPGGLQVEGYINDWTVVQQNDIPQGYLVGLVSGGPLDTRNVVGNRVHENPSARGLRLVEGTRQNYPLYDSVYDGYAGAGVGQRGAGVVIQDAAAYAAPTLSVGL